MPIFITPLIILIQKYMQFKETHIVVWIENV